MTMTGERQSSGVELVVRGTVQGVGFRPFVHQLAVSEDLSGWVRNAADGVHIVLFGAPKQIGRFKSRLSTEAPPLACIEHISEGPISGNPPSRFVIKPSIAGSISTAAAPDAAMCEDCRRELFDPCDRRHNYAFLNCTRCGPRFSIMSGIPYDRASTSMSKFTMCPACQREYDDVDDRRFHAQPTACPECGPKLWLERPDRTGRIREGHQAIALARDCLRCGEIVAVKGIGGFHLACNALDGAAIQRLRMRKARPAKPFAVMVRDFDVAAKYCMISERERDVLVSRSAPIVLLDMKRTTGQPERLPSDLAPGLDRLGVMLPYSPLHALLIDEFDCPLVMTSGNAGGDPQMVDNEAARHELSRFADAFLMHDRDIINRVDDSLVQVTDENTQMLRRARGYAPQPVSLPSGLASDHPQILALGGDIKNTFAIAKAGQVTASQHIGDLAAVRASLDLQRAIRLYGELYDFKPALVAADLHPGYRSRQLAAAISEDQDVPMMDIWHHHAHAASCMVEHGLAIDHPPVLALVQDGIGLGADGALLGAELLICDYRSARRLATLRPAALAGGDKAAQEPWRNLAIRLDQAYLNLGDWPDPFRHRLKDYPAGQVIAAARAGINAPPCSSAGRLFDAIAAAAGLCVHQQDYEGEAAMRLQAAAERWLRDNALPKGYSFQLERFENGNFVVQPARLWKELAADLDAGVDPGRIATRFHVGWARSWIQAVRQSKNKEDRCGTVILSGGVFQNRLLASIMRSELETSGLTVLEHGAFPANDGGLALGQIAVALARWQEERSEQPHVSRNTRQSHADR